jgi:hypothetical protein
MRRPLDPNSPATRIRAVLVAVNRSAADLARVCGFSRQNMQRFLDGEIARSKYYPAIAKELGVSLTWLLTGDPMHAPTWWQPESTPAQLGADQQSRPGSADQPVSTTGELPPHWRIASVPHGKVLGPAINGSHVILDPSLTPKEGDLIVLPDTDPHRVRRLGPTIGGRVVLVAADGSCRVETVLAPLTPSVSVVVGMLFSR